MMRAIILGKQLELKGKIFPLCKEFARILQDLAYSRFGSRIALLLSNRLANRKRDLGPW